jgi:hypothetical protein
MTLAVAFKGPEGIVLAADSRVTLTFQKTPKSGGKVTESHAYYDHATKLLRLKSHPYVAAVTYGLGVIDTKSPRTAHSYMPEFGATLGDQRMSVRDYSESLGKFFADRFKAANMGAGVPDMVFLIGGFDEGKPYGLVYEVKIPSDPVPKELNAGTFGLSMGGQTNIARGMLQNLPIPYQFLPLQDCVDVSILIIKTTADLMRYITDVRGVGGAIDVATVTADGVNDVQIKTIRGNS